MVPEQVVVMSVSEATNVLMRAKRIPSRGGVGLRSNGHASLFSFILPSLRFKAEM